MTIVLVHPHPDDEAILTGGLVLHAHVRRRRVVLVTATHGEEGSRRPPGPTDLSSSLAAVRTRELSRACTLLGVDRQVTLGFRDSGLRPPPHGRAAGAFSAVPLHVAAAPIAQILREERPELVVTATPDGTYGHPDHVRACEATMAALDQLRSEGWAPTTVAMVAFPHGLAALLVHGILAFGLRPSGWLLREGSVSGVPGSSTRFILLGSLMPRKRAAVLAHQSQLRGWLGLALRLRPLCRLVFGVERYAVASSPAGAVEPRRLFSYV